MYIYMTSLRKKPMSSPLDEAHCLINWNTNSASKALGQKKFFMPNYFGEGHVYAKMDIMNKLNMDKISSFCWG